MKEEDFEFPMVTANNMSLAKRKLVFGVGVNDAEYKISYLDNKGKTYFCPYHKRWRGMIERGYSEKWKETHTTYKDVTVCEEWHTFSTFKLWMEKQDWVGKQLDKDIIVPNNKVYSPETCVFVSHRVNTLLLSCGSSRGLYKQGVTYLKLSKENNFQARYNSAGIRKHIGNFPTEDQAYEAYVTYKHALILQVADEQEDIRVKNGLLLHAQILLDTLEDA